MKIGRRDLLKGTAGALAWLGAGCPDYGLPSNPATFAAFPDGVVAAPEADGVHVVARVTDLTGAPFLFFEVARDREFRDLLGYLESPGGHVRFTLTGVAPSTRVYYRLRSQRSTSTIGSLRTLPAVDDARDVRVALFSCQGWQAGYYSAHRGIAGEELDLVVSLGDYIYELTDDFGPRVDTIGIHGDGFAETLDEYRQKYQLYRIDGDLQAMHAAHGFVGVWDNHELADDGAGHLQGRTPRVPLEERKANGRAAFWEYTPMDPGPAERPLYRSLRLGANLEIFLLDLHSHVEGASYLGAAQRAWLFDGLAASTARWKLIASSTVMMGLDLAPGMPVNLNQWDGYPDERRALVEHVIAQDIRGVVVMSGDLHTFLGAAGFVEFSGGAISSLGLFDLAPTQTQAARSLEAVARTNNPHLDFIDILARGYAVVEARRDELLVTFRSPENAWEQRSPVRDLARFRVEHGVARVLRIA